MTRNPKTRTERISEALGGLAKLYEQGELLLASDPVAFIDQVISELLARRARAEPGEAPQYREGHEFVVCTACGSHILVENDLRRFDPEYWLDVSSPRMLYVTCDWDGCGEEFLAEVHQPDHKARETASPKWYSYDCDEQYVEHPNELAAFMHLQQFIEECRSDFVREGEWPDGITDPETSPRWGIMLTVGKAVGKMTDEGPDFDLRRNDGTVRTDTRLRASKDDE